MEVDDLLPLQMDLIKVKKLISQGDNFLTIFLVLKGNVSISINGREHRLAKDDIYVVNPNERFYINSKVDNLILNVKISINKLEDYLKYSWQRRFICYSNSEKNCENTVHKFRIVKEELCHMMISYFMKNTGYEIEVNKYLYSILSNLIKEFEDIEVNKLELNDSITDEKILNIVRIINKNYRQVLSLEELAQSEFISYSHLSRSFKKNIGITFTEYLNKVRITHAANDLKRTNTQIDKIALNNGFANVKIFYKVFKEYFNDTPKNYRLMYKGNEKNHVIISNESDYTEVIGESALKELSKYIVKTNFDEENVNRDEALDLSLNSNSFKQYKELKKIIKIGTAYDGLSGEVQNELRLLHEELQFDLVQFEGFCKETNGSVNGNMISEYVLNNQLFDFLNSIKVYPLIQLKLPKNINTNDEVITWCEDQLKIIRHFINRYGKKIVRNWHFEYLDEAQINSELSCNCFMLLHEKLKNLLTDMNIGLLSLTSLQESESIRFKTLIKYLKEKSINLTFITFLADPHVSLTSESKMNKFGYKRIKVKF